MGRKHYARFGLAFLDAVLRFLTGLIVAFDFTVRFLGDLFFSSRSCAASCLRPSHQAVPSSISDKSTIITSGGSKMLVPGITPAIINSKSTFKRSVVFINHSIPKPTIAQNIDFTSLPKNIKCYINTNL